MNWAEPCGVKNKQNFNSSESAVMRVSVSSSQWFELTASQFKPLFFILFVWSNKDLERVINTSLNRESLGRSKSMTESPLSCFFITIYWGWQQQNLSCRMGRNWTEIQAGFDPLPVWAHLGPGGWWGGLYFINSINISNLPISCLEFWN